MNKITTNKIDIYDYLTNKIISKLEPTLSLGELDKQKLYLGIITLLINIIKVILVCSIAITIGLLKEVVVMMVIFCSLRLTSAGLHAKSSMICTITSLIFYLGGAYLSNNFTIPFNTSFIVCIIFTTLLVKYSPADTENRPILGKENRKRLKKETLIICICFLGFNLLLKSIKVINLTMYVMIFQTISILPYTYKLLKMGYKNYERYEE